MADNGQEKKPSMGRGSFLLEAMRKKKEEEEQAARAASAVPVSLSESTVPTAGPSSIGRGRGGLREFLKTMKSAETPTPAQISKPPQPLQPPQPAVSQGRASLLSFVKRASMPGPSSTAESVDVPPDPGAGVLGRLSELAIYDTKPVPSISRESSEPISRRGTSGTTVQLSANYVNLKTLPGKGLYQYEVLYNPDIDATPLRRNLLNQHSVTLGKTKTFDGALLYLPHKLPQDRTVLQSQHPGNGSTVTLTIVYKKEQVMSENIQFFNNLLGRMMRALQLVRIGRESFNPHDPTEVPQHRLQIWPGYITAIHEYEGGLKLCIDTRHRVMRTQTVRDLIMAIHAKSQQSKRFRENVINDLMGKSVLTRYNNKTYRIDDIDWEKTPKFRFEKGGNQISLLEYYQNHWNIQIRDSEQPLLVHRKKEKLSTGESTETMILLVPELCFITGLTDDIRQDFRVMKDLDSVTKLSPNNRRNEIRSFIKKVKSTEITRQILAEWGLEIEDDTISMQGRVLDVEEITFGQNKKFRPRPDRPADWSSALTRSPMLRTPHLNHWFLLHCQRDSKTCQEFVQMLAKVGQAMSMNIQRPRVFTLADDRPETYLRELRNNLQEDVELVVIVFPSNRTDRYSAVKKVCCVEKPIPSQVIMSRTISRGDKLKSVTEKIALQINCKLGGALWALQIPFSNCMVCGIDVYHAGIGQSGRGSVAGFVASTDRLLTSWYSKVCLQAPHQELIDLLQVCLVSAIKAYFKRNGKNPDMIIVYRDGVGDGQLDVVAKYEVKQLLDTLSHIEPGYEPKLSIIVVQKRINTRLFLRQNSGLENPPPGTVVDSDVTRRNYNDFFLVSQNVRHGTVTPTHYIVVFDSSRMKADHVQRFTYKLCHLYYNWPGTIRIPAPCQYAHKLVYLVGQNIQIEPHQSLTNRLFYL